MAIQNFTAGQVLTAAQMNALQANDYNQTVSTKTASYTLVAADKGTRIAMNAATDTAITVNTSLFTAGDTLFLQNINTGVCTVTAGTATVSTNSTLVLRQNEGGVLYFTSAGVAIFFGNNAPRVSWTPVLSGWGIGNGTIVGSVIKIGNLVNSRVEITFGSTSTFAGTPSVTFPYTPVDTDQIHTAGLVYLYDVSTGNQNFATQTSVNTIRVLNAAGTYLSDSAVSSSVPFTWATGDYIVISMTYETAS